jgi:hypothetical protein
MIWQRFQELNMKYAVRVLITSISVVLLGLGVWANLSSSKLFEMRGTWVKHSIRGPASVL